MKKQTLPSKHPSSSLISASGLCLTAASEGPLVNSLRQVLWGVKWTFIPPPFPRPRNSFKRQRKILIYAFLWLENCSWNWPLPSFLLGKADSGDVAVKCCTAWLDSILYKYKMKIAQGLVLKTGDTLPRERKKNVYTISALVSFACIIYVTPTNYLGLALSKSQNAVDLLEGIFSLSHHAPQSSLHPKDVSSPTSDTAELRLLLF